MAIREGLLALLSERPKYGYQLKAEFEARTGAAWPLNVGQVYTTLDRLERDGFVSSVAETGGEAERRRRYQLTDAGRDAQEGWFAASAGSDVPPRDDLVMKVLLAVHVDGIDALAVVRVQRTARVERLQVQRRRQREAGADGLSERLVADALAIRLESEVRWLDLCEERLAQEGRTASKADAVQYRK